MADDRIDRSRHGEAHERFGDKAFARAAGICGAADDRVRP
jgi:hypothetical protein